MKTIREIGMWISIALVAIFLLVVSSISHGQTIKRFQWGVESWVSQQSDLTIQINESKPISIISIEGAITASPVASFNINDNLNRETLVTLVNEGAVHTNNITILTHPQGTNHSITKHIFSVNAKVTGPTAVVVPVHFNYEAQPIGVPFNKLTLHVDNSSWRAFANGDGYQDKTAVAAVDVEIQLTVTYRVNP
jgi:hypothetical protein